ncbi:MAG: alpha/beta fold hydrolase [Saprospiraceae bacterium]
MPVLQKSTYRRSALLRNGHIESIYPAIFRKVTGFQYERERLELPDDDFVDLDWLDSRSRKLIVLTHGLEGDSDRQYIRGMARLFLEKKWDVLAWNCRSCSGEMNRQQRMYHHGDIEDIGGVIAHALRTKDYESIVLAGFSMGGNISMKYLGVHGKEVPAPIKAGIAFSSPTDLKAGAEVLDQRSNFIYRNRFMRLLKIKIEQKVAQYPGVVDLSRFNDIKAWWDFDEFFSAPLNGFAGADDFYEKASAKNFMAGITVPTLLVQAKNDPILPPACYPVELCRHHPHVFLEMPAHGGHCGFWQPAKKYAWSELRAWEFLEKQVL